jgi:hypothetical protein
MTVLMVQYEVAKEHVADVEAEIGAVIAAVEAAGVDGVRYAVGRLPDGVTFVGLLELADGVANPLPDIPAARAFQQRLAGRLVGDPPVPQALDVVGAHRLFDRP